MTELIETLAAMSNEMQNAFYTNLENTGITKEEINTIKENVFYYKLFTNKHFYNTVVESMGEEIYKEFNR